MKLAAVRIFVRDLVSAKSFYEDVLGLHCRHDGPAHGYCIFDGGGPDVVVEHVSANAPADEQALVGRFSGLSFRVADLAAEHHRLAALGVVFTGAPELQAWGGRLATLLDPAGNALQLVQYPDGA